MKLTFAVWIIFVAFYISTKNINARIDGETSWIDKKSLPTESFVSCTCDGLDMEMRMPLEKLGDLLLDVKNGTAFNHCSSCSAGVIHCNLLEDLSVSCDKEKLLDNYILTDKGEDASSGRFSREVDGHGVCNFPRNLKTSHLSCIKYPKEIKCTQRCIFGHTLEEGITREMRCEHKDNVWKPQGFQECSPFIDCSVTLVATGNQSCLLGTLYTPSVCNVTCGDYEDKLATPWTTYECQISGGWNQKLPHCAISGSGLALVPAPRVRIHTLPEGKEPEKKAKAHKQPKPAKQAKLGK